MVRIIWAVVAAQLLIKCLVTDRSWVQSLLGAGLFATSFYLFTDASKVSTGPGGAASAMYPVIQYRLKKLYNHGIKKN